MLRESRSLRFSILILSLPDNLGPANKKQLSTFICNYLSNKMQYVKLMTLRNKTNKRFVSSENRSIWDGLGSFDRPTSLNFVIPKSNGFCETTLILSLN